MIIILILLFSLFLWKYVRRFYYISKIPGPAASPIIGNALLAKEMMIGDTYLKTFRDNGNFFKLWFGPMPVVLISDPEILQTLYTNPNTLHKGWLFQKIAYSVFRNSLLIADVEKWKQNRKICNYGFTQTILNSFIPIFNNVSDSLIKQLKNEVGKTEPFDAFAYCGRATLDSVCGTAMGINLNSLLTTASPYIHALSRVLSTAAKRMCTVWLYPNFIFGLTKIGKEHYKSLKIMWDITNKVVDTKLESRNNNNTDYIYRNQDLPLRKNPLKKPFLEFLLDMTQAYPELTTEQLKDETNLLIFAGYETTATTLSYALVVLGIYKDIQEKVFKEVQEIFGSSRRAVEIDDLSKLNYLELVIKETLRLYPAIGNIVREPTHDIKLGNYFIPAGTTTVISIIETHRNPKYWDKPMEFIPERFLNNRHPYAFIPFSSGPRNCIGSKYAMMFMKIQLVNILRNYEIHSNLDPNQFHFELDTSLRLIGGYQISITERKF